MTRSGSSSAPTRSAAWSPTRRSGWKPTSRAATAAGASWSGSRSRRVSCAHPWPGHAAEHEPDPALVEKALAGVATARTAQTRTVHRLGIAAAGTSAGLVAAIVVAVVLASRPADSFAPTGQAAPLQASAGIAAAASVRLSGRPWGTQVDLRTERMPALPPGAYYEVWLVRADGTRVAAGTFRPTSPGGRARVRLAAGIPRPLVARVGVTLEGAGPGRRVLDARA